jgi:hypothetical protein
MIPERQEIEHDLQEMDRDEKKLEAFLNIHKNNLKVPHVTFPIVSPVSVLRTTCRWRAGVIYPVFGVP